MLRKVAIGSSLLAVLPGVKAATPINAEPQRPPLMRPSELPIYEAPHADYAERAESQKNVNESGYMKSAISTPVRAAREQVQYVWQQTESIKNTVQENYNEVQDRTAWIVKYLREEENKQQRYGAVVMGGLTGFIFGLRGGIFRKLLYTSAGTTLMGSICFPEETNEIAKETLTQGRHYINVAYNFFYGVKPGDPQLEVKFPELSFPKDFSQFLELTASLASSAKQAVMPPPKKADEKSKDKSN